MKRRTWQQKIGKRLTKHVIETTQRGTLREFKANHAAQRRGLDCPQCDHIGRKLGLP